MNADERRFSAAALPPFRDTNGPDGACKIFARLVDGFLSAFI
jgi:hypothetical protein